MLISNPQLTKQGADAYAAGRINEALRQSGVGLFVYYFGSEKNPLPNGVPCAPATILFGFETTPGEGISIANLSVLLDDVQLPVTVCRSVPHASKATPGGDYWKYAHEVTTKIV